MSAVIKETLRLCCWSFRDLHAFVHFPALSGAEPRDIDQADFSRLPLMSAVINDMLRLCCLSDSNYTFAGAEPRDIDQADFSRLPLMSAVIKETLRLCCLSCS
jgi:hypothetical protein